MTSVGVFAAIFDERRRMLCVRANYGLRRWTTPGGAVDAGESMLDALKRETVEESGYFVEVARLIGVYWKTYQDDVVLFFEADIVGRTDWQPDDEIAELGFFARDELPQPMSQNVRTRILDVFDGKAGTFRVFHDRGE